MTRCLMILSIALGLVAGPLNAQVAGGMGRTPPTSELRPAERVRAALAGAGITVCAPVIERAAQFLFEDGEGNFTIQPLSVDVNRWPVVLTMESAHDGQAPTRLSIVTIAPAGSCSGSYEQIITWPQSCAVIRSTVFASFTNERLLYREVRQAEASPGNQVYLMSAGEGCVSVKKELLG